MPQIASFLLAGVCAALVGIAFGLPSVRIKGFYLAVATLAAQFFVIWVFQKFSWFSNDSPSGVISAQPVVFFGFPIDSPVRNYLFVLGIVAVLALCAKNMARFQHRSSVDGGARHGLGRRGDRHPADADQADGVRDQLVLLRRGRALYAFCYIGTVEPEAFSLDMSFRVLFMIIVGGMGTIMGSFIGAAFFTLLPIFLSIVVPSLAGLLHVHSTRRR